MAEQTKAGLVIDRSIAGDELCHETVFARILRPRKTPQWRVAARTLRYEVLDRMAKLGTGLTPSQKNDWAWFREAWDEKMCDEHAQEWGGTFSQWMQQILDDLSDGVANAFSMFMYDETKRHFSKTPMLVVPSTDPE